MAYKYKLYGAILGDITGQPYEFPAMKGPYDKPKFFNPDAHITDDTIMTLASAWAILHKEDPMNAYKTFTLVYPNAGYGKRFKQWGESFDDQLGDSYGNGCLMRIAPFMYAKDLPGLIRSVQSSHNHRESFEAALKLWQAYMQCNYSTPERARKQIEFFTEFKVDAKSTIEFCLDLCSQTKTVHHVINKAVQCGGDTDTNASICAELHNFHHQGIRKVDADYVESKLDSFQLEILHKFNEQF